MGLRDRWRITPVGHNEGAMSSARPSQGKQKRPPGDPVGRSFTCDKSGVSNGTRTRDILDHNQVLYQLSYTHHAAHVAERACLS